MHRGAVCRCPKRPLPLVAPELIDLIVLWEGQTKLVEFPIRARQELPKGDRLRAERLGDRREATVRHEPHREDVAVPGFQHKMGAGLLKREDKRIPRGCHRRLAEYRAFERAHAGCERGKRARLGWFGEELGLFCQTLGRLL